MDSSNSPDRFDLASRDHEGQNRQHHATRRPLYGEAGWKDWLAGMVRAKGGRSDFVASFEDACLPVPAGLVGRMLTAQLQARSSISWTRSSQPPTTNLPA